ncbi:TD and POZ domain-containing protein 5-like [Paramacrobiotus metropolitanus]|uniref:TD and POZ domain-containing protein 5-like n=1 Tax=Paramacrobiotus metropolitanus TaxID=2943436 RepID=UPI002445C853|nr:TD and POZ domain-containing protein 5-like [Paramacrobiotus metropolitanus]
MADADAGPSRKRFRGSTSVHPRTLSPVAEIRVAFRVPASEFRMRCTEENSGSNGTAPVAKVWIYEAEVKVPKSSEHPGIASGTWVFAIKRSLLLNGTLLREKKVHASLRPTDLLRGQGNPVGFCTTLDFILGLRFPSEQSYFIWPAQNGVFNNNQFISKPLRLTFPYDHESPFCDDNSLTVGTTWSVDFLFYTNPLIQRPGATLTGLASKLDSMRKSAAFSDCALVSADGQTFPAHRVVLAAQSPVFAAMFEHNMLEKETGVCRITDIQSAVLEVILDFLYCRTVSDALKNDAETILAAAHRYNIDDLQNVCEDALIGNLNKENAVKYLGMAMQFGLDSLMKKAARMVAD